MFRSDALQAVAVRAGEGGEFRNTQLLRAQLRINLHLAESLNLTTEERKLLAKTAVEVVAGRVPVILHVSMVAHINSLRYYLARERLICLVSA